MATPSNHALLSASSAHRWLICTAAPRYEEQFPSESSVYAEEGTLAHSICEVFVEKEFKIISEGLCGELLKSYQKNPLFDEEMLRTAEVYTDYLRDCAMQYKAEPHVAIEVKVDLSRYVPEGFGTCDCVMIGDNVLRIVDYKHGKGVKVSAERNPQMMLYALGALVKYQPVYGNQIERVVMAIVQPRISDVPEEFEMGVADLLAWGEAIRSVAQEAYTGEGSQFVPGEHCRFCRGKAQCRQRAAYFQEFLSASKSKIAGRLTDDEIAERKEAIRRNDPVQTVLSDVEVARLLTTAEGLVAWYKDLQDYAYDALMSGKDIPGWKLVEGRSVRAFTDPDAAIDRLTAAGYDEAMLYDRKPKTLSAIEKMLGKKTFNELLSALVTKPRGKATLAPASDKRDSYNPAVVEFEGIGAETDG